MPPSAMLFGQGVLCRHMLDPVFIETLIIAWMKDTGEKISTEVAYDMATRAFSYFEALQYIDARSVDKPALTDRTIDQII